MFLCGRAKDIRLCVNDEPTIIVLYNVLRSKNIKSSLAIPNNSKVSYTNGYKSVSPSGGLISNFKFFMFCFSLK